jgi:hypothetical protein
MPSPTSLPCKSQLLRVHVALQPRRPTSAVLTNHEAQFVFVKARGYTWCKRYNEVTKLRLGPLYRGAGFRVPLDKLNTTLMWSRNSLPLMKQKLLLPCSQQPATGPDAITVATIQSLILIIISSENKTRPNVVVETLTLLFRIRDVLGSNIGPGDRLS